MPLYPIDNQPFAMAMECKHLATGNNNVMRNYIVYHEDNLRIKDV